LRVLHYRKADIASIQFIIAERTTMNRSRGSASVQRPAMCPLSEPCRYLRYRPARRSSLRAPTLPLPAINTTLVSIGSPRRGSPSCSFTACALVKGWCCALCPARSAGRAHQPPGVEMHELGAALHDGPAEPQTVHLTSRDSGRNGTRCRRWLAGTRVRRR